MYDVETVKPLAPVERAPLHYGSIIVVGGGCYGSYYLRQLCRARAARALTWDWLSIIDRDINCASSNSSEIRGDRISIETAEWTDFFEPYLADAADSATEPVTDAIVPSPLMPHLMYEWLLGRARERWPDRKVETRPLKPTGDFPWSRAAQDGGTRYVSFAEWTCPVNCIEPRICPHTKGERSWSIPDSLRSAMADGSLAAEELKGPVIFHCTHRAYGVGMIDTADVVAADRLVAAECREGGKVLVATASHCHGALNVLSVSG